MKKLLCILLSLIFVLSFAACKGSGGADKTPEPTSQSDGETEPGGTTNETTQGTAIKNTELVLPYSAADGLDPYKCETQMNRDLSTVLYDSLYRLDESFSPVALLAKSGEIDGKAVTVTVKKGVKFSDSSSLGASDVVYSFNLAKESKGYSEQLKNISSAYAESSRTVVFKLDSADVYALGCLTFPIVKSGSDGKTPIGSGRYYLSSGKLKANKNHVSGQKANISKIALCDIRNSANEFGSLQIGEINFAYRDLSDCKIERIVASTKEIPLNNLIYIGMKTTKGLLKDAKLRNIISCAVNRSDIVSSAFQGYATACSSPFNPLWKEAPASNEKIYTAQEIVALLDNNGYAYRNDTDKHRKNNAGKDLILTLAVNKDNAFKLQAAKMIKSDFKTVGIDIEIVELSRKDLKKAARKGKYDMYIGEVKLCPNMSLSPFFSEDGGASYYIDKSLTCVSAYNKLVSGKIKTDEFFTQFKADTPFVPLCFRKGFAAVSNSLEDNVKTYEGDLFANISEWKFK